MNRKLSLAIVLAGLSFASPKSNQVELTSKRPRPFLGFKNRNPTNYLNRAKVNPLLVYGEILFRSPFILGDKAQSLGISCQICHPNGAANHLFTLAESKAAPGTVDLTSRIFSDHRDNGIHDPLRIPSLRGVRFLAPYGHDGKHSSLKSFTKETIDHTFAGKSDEVMLDALVLYMRELDFLPNPLLKPNMRLATVASSTAKKGERIFYKKKCDACHIPTSFFRDAKVHSLRSKYSVSPWSFEGAVKTPTLLGKRNSMLHNGTAKDFTDLTQIPFHEILKSELQPINLFLKQVALEEKPYDQRHVSEIFLEILSELKIFKDKSFYRYNDLIINTIVFNLDKESSLLLTDQNSKQIVEEATNQIIRKRSNIKALLKLEQTLEEKFRFIK